MNIFFLNEFFPSFLQMILFAALSPLVSGIIKKTKALLQNRRGADIMQDYYDLRKWWKKRTIISPYSGFVFMLAPFMYLLSTMLAAFLLPNMIFLYGSIVF